MKKIVRTVNKAAPRCEFKLWHSNEKGYCPVGNREIIGICKVREILKKILHFDNHKIDIIICKIMEENKIFVFGKDTDRPYFIDKMDKTSNVFFLGGNE
jgi:hypothetical protein